MKEDMTFVNTTAADDLVTQGASISSHGIYQVWLEYSPESKVHGTNVGPTWVLSAPDGPHFGPMNLGYQCLVSVLDGFKPVDVYISKSGNSNINTRCHRDHFVYAPSQWEMTLQCNVVSHWLGAYTKWSLVLLSEPHRGCSNTTTLNNLTLYGVLLYHDKLIVAKLCHVVT